MQFTRFAPVVMLTVCGSWMLAASSVQLPTSVPPPGDDRPAAAGPRTPSSDPGTTRSERPMHTDALTQTLPSDTIQLYRDASYKDDVIQLDHVTQGNPAGQPVDMLGTIKDSMSSLRWNLPEGVVAVFYEDAGGKGEQLVLWGSGEAKSMSPWDFDNKASRWAWFYLGGNNTAPEHVKKGLSSAPYKTESMSPALTDNSMRLFVDTNLKNTMVEVPTITSTPMGQLQNLPADLKDSMSSLQWNIPPGVVVVFYQDASGLKQQAAIWGIGQIRNVDTWDFNDKVSRWAWFQLGDSKERIAGGTP